MADEIFDVAKNRIYLECLQCAWAANSTDTKTLDRLAELHERRYSDHQVVDVND